jgi:DNA repair exonuclease SbcCD ATPase subunit
LRIADEVLIRLRDRESVGEVRRSYRSSSEVCKGFQKYMDELQEEIERARGDLTDAERKLAEKQEMTKDVEDLRAEKAGLQRDVNNKRAELDSYVERVEELRKRGFTESIVTRLSETVSLNGQEVWRVLEHVEERARLEEEIDNNRKIRDQVKREVSLLDAKKQKSQNSLQSAEKKLANVEAEASALEEVVDLVELGLKAGYKIEDLRALLSYLTEKSVGKTPGQSVAHLMQLVEAVKSLEDLRAEIRLVENRLAEIRRLENETRARNDLMEKASAQAIEQQKVAGLKVISDFAGSITKWLQDLAQSFQAEIEQAKESRANVARLEQQAVNLKKLIDSAQAMMGILESNEQLKAVSPTTVISLLERIRYWVELRWANTLVGLTYDQTSLELRTSNIPIYYVIIHNLINVSIQAIEEQMVKEKQ